MSGSCCGGILIVWDRLFGTFQAEEESVVYGLTTNIDSFHVLTIAFHEWAAMTRDVRRARTCGDRWRHVLMGPGWTPIAPEPAARRLAAVAGVGERSVEIFGAPTRWRTSSTPVGLPTLTPQLPEE